MKLPVLVALIFAFQQLCAQEPRSNSFKGKVKSVEEHSFKAKKRKHTVVKGRAFREFSWEKDFRVEYDSSGRELAITSYERSGKVFRTRFFFYDSNGFGTKIIRSYDEGRKQDSSVFVNHYSSDGKITMRYVWSPFPIEVTEFVYTYDSAGIIHEYIRGGEEGYEFRREVASYFPNWLPKEGFVYNSITDQRIGTTKFEYDAAWRLTDKKICNSSGHVITSYHWKYEETGKVMRYEVCDQIKSSCAYWTYKYEDDARGNWIRCVEYRNGKPAFVKERTIFYWD